MINRAGLPEPVYLRIPVYFKYPGSLQYPDCPQKPHQRIIELVGYTFLQRNDSIVGDGDVLWANCGTTLGDIAITYTVFLLEICAAVFHIEGVHFQRCRVDHVPGPGKFLVQVVLTQYMADILTQETLDTFPELLYPVYVTLHHPPGAIRGVWPAWFEFPDPLLHPVINRDIRYEITYNGEGLHRLNSHGLSLGHITHPRHAHKPRVPIDLGRT